MDMRLMGGLKDRVRFHDVDGIFGLAKSSEETIRFASEFVLRGRLQLDNSEVGVAPSGVIFTRVFDTHFKKHGREIADTEFLS